jgi:hypothetical protein
MRGHPRGWPATSSPRRSRRSSPQTAFPRWTRHRGVAHRTGPTPRWPHLPSRGLPARFAGGALEALPVRARETSARTAGVRARDPESPSTGKPASASHPRRFVCNPSGTGPAAVPARRDDRGRKAKKRSGFARPAPAECLASFAGWATSAAAHSLAIERRLTARARTAAAARQSPPESHARGALATAGRGSRPAGTAPRLGRGDGEAALRALKASSPSRASGDTAWRLKSWRDGQTVRQCERKVAPRAWRGSLHSPFGALPSHPRARRHWRAAGGGRRRAGPRKPRECRPCGWTADPRAFAALA